MTTGEAIITAVTSGQALGLLVMLWTWTTRVEKSLASLQAQFGLLLSMCPHYGGKQLEVLNHARNSDESI